MGKIKLEKLLISKDRVDYWFTATEDLTHFFKSPMHLFIQYDHCIECVPESILVIETDKLVEMLSTVNKGCFQQDKAERIKETAPKNSLGTLLCTYSATFMLKQFVEQIKFLKK